MPKPSELALPIEPDFFGDGVSGFIGQVPTHAQQDDFRLVMTPLKPPK
jgi:hypothetical protein